MTELMAIGKVLKRHRLERDLTLDALAETLNRMYPDERFTKGKLSKWERDIETPKVTSLKRLADFLGTTIDEILTDSADLSKAVSVHESRFEYDYIDGSVAAGSLEYIDACYEFDKITLPDRLMGRYARRKSILATRINGQSMNRLIPDESFIFIDRNFNTLHQIKDGDVVVFDNEGEFSCKKIYIDNTNNRFIFRPDSDDVAFTDIIIDFENTENLKLVGKVVLYLTELD